MKYLVIGLLLYIVALLLWYKFNEKRIEKDLDDVNKTASRKHKV